jgi:hypothetical protein
MLRRLSELDRDIEALARSESESATNVSNVRRIVSGEGRLQLETTRPYERDDSRKPGINLTSLDARYRVLSHAGPFTELRLRHARPRARQIDEIAGSHFVSIVHICTTEFACERAAEPLNDRGAQRISTAETTRPQRQYNNRCRSDA